MKTAAATGARHGSSLNKGDMKMANTPTRDVTVKDVLKRTELLIINLEAVLRTEDYADRRREIAAQIRALNWVSDWIKQKIREGIGYV